MNSSRMTQRIAACVLAGCISATAHAQDLAREQRLHDEIIDMIFDGTPLMLNANGQRFLAIETEARSQTHGVVLVLHGRGRHPDWHEVVEPLRSALPESGWHTLSIQLPVLANGSKYNDYREIFDAAHPRIDAALAHLRAKGAERVVIAAHSCGVHMAMHWIEHRPHASLDGFVGIGMGATDRGQPMPEPFPLEGLAFPVLDVHGSNDYPAVRRNAPRRKGAMTRAGHAHSAQIEVTGADHDFRAHEETLVATVTAWLNGLKPE